MKKKCAKEAVRFIKDGMIIGLGGGSTIAHLANFVKEKGLDVRVVTPSYDTEKLCVELGLEVLPLRFVSHVDIAFDGCDEVDRNLYGLKSGGGIHTKEKLIANMADDYMLLVDESKVSPNLTFQVPIVLELLEDSMSYVKAQIEAMGGSFTLRTASGKYGPLKSDYGQILADTRFDHIEDPKKLNHQIKAIAGVLDTSLVTREITKVLIVKEDGFELLEK